MEGPREAVSRRSLVNELEKGPGYIVLGVAFAGAGTVYAFASAVVGSRINISRGFAVAADGASAIKSGLKRIIELAGIKPA